MTLRSLELFAGIGGLSLGLERAGLCRPAAFCEIDPYARAVLKRHWPEVPCYEDARTLNADTLDAGGIGRVDLIAAGFPCQPFSSAGNQLGEQDERHLWPEVARLLGETRAGWLVAENVPHLLTIDRGRTFGRILADLDALGFYAEWHKFPAAAVGARHLRERLFIVAAHPDRVRELQPEGRESYQRGRPVHGVGDAPEPELVGMVHGLPDTVDRLRCLGNAVYPAHAAVIGRAIVEAQERCRLTGSLPDQIVTARHLRGAA